MSKKSEKVKGLLLYQLLKLTKQKCLHFFRFFNCWYLKLTFVSNTFWTKIPKSSHCEPLGLYTVVSALKYCFPQIFRMCQNAKMDETVHE